MSDQSTYEAWTEQFEQLMREILGLRQQSSEQPTYEDFTASGADTTGVTLTVTAEQTGAAYNGTMLLSWDSFGLDTIKEFRIFRCPGTTFVLDDAQLAAIAEPKVGDTQTAKDTGATPGSTYTWGVQAISTIGLVSDVVVSADALVPYSFAPTVTGMGSITYEVDPQDDETVDLIVTWEPPDRKSIYFSYYEVQLSSDSGGTWGLIQTVTAEQAIYHLGTLEPDAIAAHRARVRIIDTFGNVSDWITDIFGPGSTEGDWTYGLVTPTVETRVDGRSITVITTTPGAYMPHFSHFETQASIDGVTWYAPAPADRTGDSWYVTGIDAAIHNGTYLHSELPLDADGTRTYQYRSRCISVGGHAGAWSAAVSGVARGIDSIDVIDGAIERGKIEGGFVDEHEAAFGVTYPSGIDGSSLSDWSRPNIQSVKALLDKINDDTYMQESRIFQAAREIKFVASEVDGATTKLASIEIEVDEIKTLVAEITDGEVDLSQVLVNKDQIASIVASGEYLDADGNLQNIHTQTIVNQINDEFRVFAQDGTLDGAESASWAVRPEQVESIVEETIAGDETVAQIETTSLQTKDKLTSAARYVEWVEDKMFEMVSMQEITRRKIETTVAEIEEGQSTLASQITQEASRITQRVRAQTWDDAAGQWVAQEEAFLQLGVNRLPSKMSRDRYRGMEAATTTALMSAAYTGEGTLSGGYYETYSITDGVVPGTAAYDDLVDALRTAGMLVSQFLLDADEILIDGTIRGRHMELDSASIDIFESIRAKIADATITKLDSTEIDVQNLTAQVLRLNNSGALVGGGYADDGTPTGGAGVFVGADGIMKAVGGEFESINVIDGFFSGTIDSGPLLLDPTITTHVISESNTTAKALFNNQLAWLVGGSWTPVDDFDLSAPYISISNAVSVRITYTETPSSGTNRLDPGDYDPQCKNEHQWYIEDYDWERVTREWRMEAMASDGTVQFAAHFMEYDETRTYYRIDSFQLYSGTNYYCLNDEWNSSPERVEEIQSQEGGNTEVFSINLQTSGKIYRLRDLPTGPGVSGDVYVDGNGFLKVTP